MKTLSSCQFCITFYILACNRQAGRVLDRVNKNPSSFLVRTVLLRLANGAVFALGLVNAAIWPEVGVATWKANSVVVLAFLARIGVDDIDEISVVLYYTNNILRINCYIVIFICIY